MTRKNQATPLALRTDNRPLVKGVIYPRQKNHLIIPLLGVACIECEQPARYMNVTLGLVYHYRTVCQTKAAVAHGCQ